MLKRLRLVHLYLGLFLAPMILFFAFSGMLQLFHKHEAQPGDTSQPARWIAVMAAMHKDQNTEVHERKLQPARPGGPNVGNVPLKTFFAFECMGLMLTTLIGIYMAFRYNRSHTMIWSLLIAGTVVPLILLKVG